jgi:hypothetical protein
VMAAVMSLQFSYTLGGIPECLSDLAAARVTFAYGAVDDTDGHFFLRPVL